MEPRFFVENREHFFKPLTGKYREVSGACLKALYQRLFSPDADYAYHLSREDLRDIFTEVVRETPVLSQEYMDEDREYFHTAKDESGKASEILRYLIDCGWIENYLDKGAMISAYRFTRAGKLFSECLFRLDFKGFKTRQRNVRNTKNSLEAYARDADPYDLIDAVDYAQQVVSDLSDDISDLHERKRQLMKAAVEKISIAVEDFLQYMDQHFIPDLAIRLTADSVERHRHRIREITEQIRGWPREKFHKAEERLCQIAGQAIEAENPLLPRLLNLIHHSVESACATKAPELRAALDSFVNRADLIIKQATALCIGMQDSSVIKALQYLGQLPATQQDELLKQAETLFATARVKLVDPNAIKLRKTAHRKSIATLSAAQAATAEEQLQALMRDALDLAFAVSMDTVRNEVEQQINAEGVLSTANFLVKDVPSLLALSHALELASMSAQNKDCRFELQTTDRRFETPYLSANEYLLRKLPDE